MDMKKLLESMSQFEGSEMDRSPGSPYDRGGADADYDRSPRPHKMVSNEQGGKDMVKLTDPKEIEEYMAGYEDGEKSKGKHYPDDDLDEGTGMAQLYKDEFEDHMHAEHSARAEGDDEAAREHLEAAEEAAENYHNITGQKLVSNDYDGDSPYITNPDVGNNYGDFDDEDEDDIYEGIVGSMKKFRNALKIPTGAKKFPGAEIPSRAINAIQRNRTAAALKNMNKVGDNPDSTASDFGRAVTDYGQRRDNMTGREKVGESLTISATDNDAYSLMRMVSLAGVPGAEKVEPMEPYSPYSAHADMPVGGVIYDGDSTGCSAVNCSDSNCPTHGHDMMPMEEYANEPDESTCEVSSVTDNAGLGGLNGPKKQYPFAANRSENPLAKADISERATKLAGMYNKFKGK
jgi:hypothetical protein